MDSNVMVAAPIAALLLGALTQGVLGRLLSSKVKGWMAFVFGVIAAAAVVAMWPSIYRGETLGLTLSVWDGPISLALRVDGLSHMFALMGSVIGAAVLLYAVDYMSEEPSATRFYVIMQVFIAGLLLFVYAEDLLLMYAGWEVVGLCSFLLVSFWYKQEAAAAGARKVLVMTHIAGYALLAAILVLFARTGSTLWTDPAVKDAFTGGLFALMLVAALAKSVQFPLHTWIASAMSAPTPVSALLHAACYVKAGVYLVARMHSFAPWPAAWQSTVVWIGTATALIGVLFAMIQTDAKRLLAFSTVSQIGYMMLGLGIGTPLGIAAALLHTINHGVFKGGLFLGAGAVQHATGTRDMEELGGLGRLMPKTTALWLVSAGGITGVPLLNGFVSKWLLYVAALSAGFTLPGLLAWIVSVLTMFTFMAATNGLFFGEPGEASGHAHESPRTMLAGMGALAVVCVALGVAPQLGLDYIIAPALTGLGLTADLGVTWLGLSSGAGSWYATTGVVMALASLLPGGVAYLIAVRGRSRAGATPVLARPAIAAGGPAITGLQPLAFASTEGIASGPFTGGAPLPAGSRMRASEFSASVREGLAPFFKYFDVDRYYLAIWRWTQRVTGAVAGLVDTLESHAVISMTLLAACVGWVAGVTVDVTRVEHAGEALLGVWPVIAAAGTALAALVSAATAAKETRKSVWVMLLAGGLALGALAVDQEIVRLIGLEGSAVAVLMLLALTRVDRAARNTYLAAVVLSAVALVTGTLLIETGPAALVLGLLLAGFAVKLAIVPAHLWLPKVAEKTPAPVIGLIIAIVDVAAFAELVTVRQSAPWLFAESWPWITLAVLSAIGGAGLGLAQRDLKRFLAFSTVTDAGFILIGITVGGEVGLTGAIIGIAAHALAKSLLFTCVAAAEKDGQVTLAVRGLARRHPVASAGFVAGSLAALGVPPTVGYAGHWRLYSSALSVSPWVLAALVVATALSVLAYTRFIALVWWGGEGDESTDPEAAPVSVWRSEKVSLVLPIVLLVTVILALGMWPSVL